MADIVELVPGMTDQEYADDLRQRVIEAYKPLIAVLQEATDKHFIVNATVGQNQVSKRIEVIALQILKGF